MGYKRINLLSGLIEQGRLQPGHGVQRVRCHKPEGTDLTRDLPYSGKYNMDWMFLCELRDYGRELAAKWLAHAPHVKAAKTPARQRETAAAIEE